MVREVVVAGLLTLPVTGGAESPEWEGAMRASLEKMAATLTETLKPWPVPGRVCRVEDYGAKGDGTTMNTEALQRAIDACSAAGGGVVLAGAGDYVTGTLVLKSRVMLEVAKGARVLGSTNIADYPAHVPVHETVMDTWMKEKQSLIYAEDCEEVGIRGEGVIDGRGSRQNFPGKGGIGPLPDRPFLIRMIECKKVVMEGIHLRNAGAWMQNYLACDDVIIEHENVENVTNWNNDGFDIDGCHNVIVRDCFSDSEDDGLCFKGASLRTMENVLVEDSEFYSTCNAVKFGTDSQGGFRNVLIRNVKIGGPGAELPVNGKHVRAISGVSWLAVDGGTVENVLVTNVRMDRAESPFCLRLGDRGRVKPDMAKPAAGGLRRVVFEHVTGDGNGKRGSLISGIPGARVEDAVFRDVHLTVSGGGTAEDAARVVPELAGVYPDAYSFGKTLPAYGFWIRHAEGITLDDVAITPEARDAREEFVVGEDTKEVTILPGGRRP